jgi:hypothetical protein
MVMRNTKSKISKGLFAAAVAAVCVVGFTSATETAEAKRPGGGGGGGGGIYCLDVWRPVLCPDGNIYSNDCYALRAGQVGCVPWGGDVM